MDNYAKLREMIRKIITNELDEMSTTDGAGAYLTPRAFRGNVPAAIDKERKNSTTAGFKLTPRGETDLATPADKIEIVKKNLEENRYYQYKRDETATPTKKIAMAISELNKNLIEVERVLKMNTRLKKESNITSEELYSRTRNGLIKLESRLLTLATRIREIRGQ